MSVILDILLMYWAKDYFLLCLNIRLCWFIQCFPLMLVFKSFRLNVFPLNILRAWPRARKLSLSSLLKKKTTDLLILAIIRILGYKNSRAKTSFEQIHSGKAIKIVFCCLEISRYMNKIEKVQILFQPVKHFCVCLIVVP